MHAIPASLEYLTLGPVHGPFRPQDLKQLPALKTFTSVLTYMRDDEVQDIVCYPSMRVLRRILDGSSMAPHWAVEQVGCISKSPALERLEIVIFGRPAYTSAAAEVARDGLKEVTKDPRVVIPEDCRGWLDIVFVEFQDYRLAYLGLWIFLFCFLKWFLSMAFFSIIGGVMSSRMNFSSSIREELTILFSLQDCLRRPRSRLLIYLQNLLYLTRKAQEKPIKQLHFQ